jgi:3-oxoacyl-[acyl-carrier-protein] synthase-3
VLVVGAEVFSRILTFNDRTTCVLFGDGAGAVVLEAPTSRHPGHRAARRRQPCGHSVRARQCVGRRGAGRSLLKMDGRPCSSWPWACWTRPPAPLDKAGMTEADIDWLIPHQANIRIMQSTARKLKLPMDKVVVTVDQHGNTSAASIRWRWTMPCATARSKARRAARGRGRRLHLGCGAPENVAVRLMSAEPFYPIENT